MRTIILFLLLATSFFCSSQDLETGFYEVGETEEGIKLKELESEAELYVKSTPVLTLADVAKMHTSVQSYDPTHSIVFELDANAKEKFKDFTKNNHPTKMALVIDEKVFSSASIFMPITEGVFVLNGFTEKKAKAILNKLLDQQLGLETGKVLFANKNFTIYQDRALYRGYELYNSRKDYKAFMERENTTDNDCKRHFESYYNPLSLIGTWYSYEVGEAAEEACGSQGNTLKVRTVNGAASAPVSLTDVFTETSILNALKNDSWVQEMALQTHFNWELVTTFPEILNWLNNLNYGTFTKDSFAILEQKEGKVAVRWVAEQYMGFNHHQHFQLGLWLTPKKTNRTMFRDEVHFYMGKFKNGLEK